MHGSGAALAKAIRAVGKPNFYREVGQYLVAIIPSKQYIVVRYAIEGSPEFIVNDVLPAAGTDLYLAGAYRFDPLLKIWRAAQVPACETIKQLELENDVKENYLDGIFRRCFIHDELALLVPAPAPVCVAFCLERDKEEYSLADLEEARNVLPTITELVRLHIDTCVLRSSSLAGPSIFDDYRIPLAVVDKRGRIVHTNAPWREGELSTKLPSYFTSDMVERGNGDRRLDGDWRLFWSKLDHDFPLAPLGVLVTAHKGQSDGGEENFETAFARFCKRYALTQRETAIARLALLGVSSAYMAQELHLSSGSVRNHRSNIYSKLDVTSEREFFRMFLAEFLTKSANDLSP